MTPATGADIESICAKCGDVWHVVVAKVGQSIAKVQCKECGAVHRHRPPGGVAAKAAKTGVKRTSRKAASEALAAEPKVLADTSRPIRKYAASDAYEAKDQVNHPTFGLGVVEEVLPGKIQVWFPQGRRVLAAAKPAQMLAPGGRARPFSNDS